MLKKDDTRSGSTTIEYALVVALILVMTATAVFMIWDLKPTDILFKIGEGLKLLKG